MQSSFCFLAVPPSSEALTTSIEAKMVNKHRSLFHKPDSSKPLHPRWGDVAISVPTDGSWNQYYNPYRPDPEWQTYGPGFVPDSCPRLPPLKDDDEETTSTTTGTTTSSSRSSVPLGELRPKRLSVHWASRSKQLPDESQTEQKKLEFAYKPIHQDYPSEVIEKSSQKQQHISRFRYIPTNGKYLENIRPAVSRSRSASCGSPRSSIMESPDEEPRGRSQSTNCDCVNSDQRVDGRRLNSKKSPSRGKTSCAVADRKRSSFIRPMTMTMVPNDEELY